MFSISHITTGILNRFLGDFLDITELDLSIWEGAFTLNNIAIKSTALNELRLPIRVVAGNVGKLEVKLPWRNIYHTPVEVHISDVYLVAVASKVIAYDEHAEEAALLQYKLAHLKFLEDKEKELEERLKAPNKPQSEKPDAKPDPNSPLSFSESLIEVIKRNLHIRVDSVHIRYEDNGPGYRPFSSGLVLSSFSLETTSAQGVPTFIPDEMPTLYKVLSLQGLGVYFNSCENITTRGAQPSPEEKATMIQILGHLVHEEHDTLDYIFGPISTPVRLRETSNPHKSTPPFSIPKTILEMFLKTCSVNMTCTQVSNAFRLVKKIMEFTSRPQSWRKYRPLVNHYRGHYKLWWKFAIQCILTEIRRKNDMWRWRNFRDHVKSCKAYTDALLRAKFKVSGSSRLSAFTQGLLAIPSADEQCIRSSEAELSLLNIILCRKKAQLKAERYEEYNRKHPRSWFSSYGGNQELEELMSRPWSREEKEKLILAADFCETEEPPRDPGTRYNYPLSYIGLKIVINVKDLNLTVKDNNEEDQIAQMKIFDFIINIDGRPANNGTKLQFSAKNIQVTGPGVSGQAAIDDDDPNYILRTRLKSGKEITFTYEKFPLDSTADGKFTMEFSKDSIEFLHYATTVQRLVQCCK